mgnify:CR=1 FL=1
MFFALYKYLPSRRIRWQSAALAAVFTGVFFELFKIIFTAYLRSFNPGSLYTGTLYTIVIVVLWVYYSSFFFIVGGEVGRFRPPRPFSDLCWAEQNLLRRSRGVQ